jgi:hypothetical protein
VVLYTLFAGVGMLSFDRPESEYRPDRVERSAARRDAAAPGHFGNEPGAHPT